ncbi:hypothetical protein ACHHYP_09295 [Achlya hypogyna]|uniref:Secreted protein n=1 Tax=Achlya hypogyna TaxID=1202772 RepID=A0A0A7CP33_ACHHY|nr:secreted protein [Achlya hypogyna]OQR98039.1 hypothetical protein ACHHYP_09295 [Achlya hypogyna]
MWRALLATVVALTASLAAASDSWPYEHVLQVSSTKELRASGMEATSKLWLLLYCDANEAHALSVLNDVAGDMPYAVNAGWLSKEAASALGLQSLKPPMLVQLREAPAWNPYKERLYRPPEPVPITPSQVDARTIKKVVRERAPSKVLTSWNSSWPATETRIILVTKKRTPSVLYKSLSIEYPTIAFYLVGEDDGRQFSAETLPALFVGKSLTSLEAFPADKDLTSYDDLAAFVAPHVPAATDDTSATQWLSPQAFEDALEEATATKKAEAWLVVAQPEPSAPLDVAADAAWQQCVDDIRAKAGLLVHIAFVQCPADVAWCATPLVGYLPYGAGAKSVAQLQRLPSVAAAASTVLASLPDTTSALYGETDLNAFFGRMLSRNVISFVLFTTKSEAPVLFQALALAFPDKLQFGVVYHPTPEIKTQFGISHVPAMVAVMAPRDSGVPKEQFAMAFYDKKTLGPPTFENVERFLSQVVATYAPSAAEPATTKDAVVVLEATDSASFAETCQGAVLCVVGVVERGNEHAELWTELATNAVRNGSPFVFLWVDGRCQARLAQQLGVESWQVPAVTVYSPVRHRFAAHAGVLDSRSVAAFAHAVLYSKTATSPVDGALEWTDAEACVAVPEPTEPIVEEDLEDMADMMQEILADEARQKEELKRALKEEEEAQRAAEKAKAPKDKPKKKKKKGKKTKPTKDEL